MNHHCLPTVDGQRTHLVTDKFKVGSNLVSVKFFGHNESVTPAKSSTKAGSKSARRPAYHHGDLRQALVVEATRVLEQEGPEGISLRALARSLDVSHGAPAHHFADRNELLFEIAADGYEALADRLTEVLDRLGVPDDTEKFYVETGLAYVDAALASPQRFRLMFGCSTPPEAALSEIQERLVRESSRAYRALLLIAHRNDVEAVDKIQASSYKMAAAEFTIWSMVHGAATLYIDRSLQADEKAFHKLLREMLANWATSQH